MYERFGWKEEDHVSLDKKCPFLSFDPGNDGAVVAWSEGHVDTLWSAERGSLEQIAAWCLRHGARVIVSETQFMGANPVSILELSYSCGLFIGYLSGLLPWGLAIVECPPSTWQKIQRRRMADVGIQLDRSDGIKLAKEDYLRHVNGVPLADYYLAPTALREGMASAHGLGQWWLSHITRRKDDGAFYTPEDST